MTLRIELVALLGITLLSTACPVDSGPAVVSPPAAPAPTGEELEQASESPAGHKPQPPKAQRVVSALEGLDPEGIQPSDRQERLDSGALLRPAGDVSLGLAGTYELDGTRRHRLTVAFDQYSFDLLLRNGELARAGHSRFRLGTAGGGSAEVSWEREFRDDSARLIVDAQTDFGTTEPVRLAEMGLYRLSDGRVLGIGNVIAGRKGPRVTISVYPKGYQEDPMMGQDRHFLAVEGAILVGDHASLRLVSVQPRAQGEFGRVALRALE